MKIIRFAFELLFLFMAPILFGAGVVCYASACFCKHYGLDLSWISIIYFAYIFVWFMLWNEGKIFKVIFTSYKKT